MASMADAWRERCKAGGRCFTESGTFTPWGAKCLVDGMHTLGRSIEFAHCMHGRNRYTWKSDQSILSEFESVHGGPRMGEPDCRQLISVETFCEQVVADHALPDPQHVPSELAKAKSWFGDVPWGGTPWSVGPPTSPWLRSV